MPTKLYRNAVCTVRPGSCAFAYRRIPPEHKRLEQILTELKQLPPQQREAAQRLVREAQLLSGTNRSLLGDIWHEITGFVASAFGALAEGVTSGLEAVPEAK